MCSATDLPILREKKSIVLFKRVSRFLSLRMPLSNNAAIICYMPYNLTLIIFEYINLMVNKSLCNTSDLSELFCQVIFLKTLRLPL